MYKNQSASGVTICLPNLLRWYLIFLAIEERESEVLQLECSMESSLPGEQEQGHSAGTDIIIIDYRRWYLLWKIIIYMEQFVESDCLRAVQILVNTVQKWGKIMQIRIKKYFLREWKNVIS